MAYAAHLVAKIHPAAYPAATPRAEPRRLSSLRVGALSGSTTVKQQKFVAKSAISAVEGGDTFVGVKRNTRPIIVIDNYDSFTYNLCQYMGEVGANFEVYRNDEITVEEIKKISPRGILISPGPGTPQDSGISLQTVTELGPSIPLFGVCMGLQCIGEAFGGKVVRSPYGVVHGKGSLVHYDEKLDGTLFSDLPNPFQAGRYHSLVIEKDSFPHDTLEIVAWTDDGLIMAARHRIYKHIQVCIGCLNWAVDLLMRLGPGFTDRIANKIAADGLHFTPDGGCLGMSLDSSASVYQHTASVLVTPLLMCTVGVQFHPESIITTEGRLMVNNFIKIIEGYEALNCSP